MIRWSSCRSFYHWHDVPTLLKRRPILRTFLVPAPPGGRRATRQTMESALVTRPWSAVQFTGMVAHARCSLCSHRRCSGCTVSRYGARIVAVPAEALEYMASALR